MVINHLLNGMILQVNNRTDNFFQETASAVDEVSAVDDFSPTASDFEL